MESRYIDPLTDFGFKRIFGNEDHKSITISFLNSVLNLDIPIVSITFGNLDRAGDTIEDKKSIFNIFCIDENNREFIVELQRAKQIHFIDRSIYHVGKQIIDMGIKGKKDYILKPIYFVGILEDSEPFPDDDCGYIRSASLRLDSPECDHRVISNKLQFTYIELKKFNKRFEDLNENEEWIYFLKNLLEMDSPVFEKDEFREAFEIAEFSNLKGSEKVDYELSLKENRDRFAEIQSAKLDGEAIGLEKAKLETVRKSLEKGLDLETISFISGLPLDEIQALS